MTGQVDAEDKSTNVHSMAEGAFRHWHTIQCVFTEGCSHSQGYRFWFFFQLAPPYIFWILLCGLVWYYRDPVIKNIPNFVPGVRVQFRKRRSGDMESEPIVDMRFEDRCRMLVPRKKWMICSLMIPMVFIIWYIWDSIFVKKHVTYMFPTRFCHDGWDCFYTNGTYSFLSWPKYEPLLDCDNEHLKENQHFYKCFNWVFGFSEMMACFADVGALAVFATLVTIHTCSVDLQDIIKTGVTGPDIKKVANIRVSQELRDSIPDWRPKLEDLRLKMRSNRMMFVLFLTLSVLSFMGATYFYGEFVTTIAGWVFVPCAFMFLALLTQSRYDVLTFMSTEISRLIEESDQDEMAMDGLKSDKVGAFLDTIEDLSAATKQLLKSQGTITDYLAELMKRQDSTVPAPTPVELKSKVETLESLQEQFKDMLKEQWYRTPGKKEGALHRRRMHASLRLEARLLAMHRRLDDGDESDYDD